jgi:hypothetical protein
MTRSRSFWGGGSDFHLIAKTMELNKKKRELSAIKEQSQREAR